MIPDLIIEEVHRIREEMLAEFNGDLHALCESICQETAELRRSGREVLPPTLRTPVKPVAGR